MTTVTMVIALVAATLSTLAALLAIGAARDACREAETARACANDADHHANRAADAAARVGNARWLG